MTEMMSIEWKKIVLCIILIDVAYTMKPLCDSGSEWKNNQCQPCHSDYFRANPVYDLESGDFLCTEKYSCDKKGMATLYNGSRTEDRVCHCRLDQGYYLTLSWQNCTANDGYKCNCAELTCNGSEGIKLVKVYAKHEGEEDTVNAFCETCANGTYQPNNGRGPCLSCSTAENPDDFQTCKDYKPVNNTAKPTNNYTTSKNGTEPDILQQMSWTTWGLPVSIIGAISVFCIVLGVILCCCCKKNKLLTPSSSYDQVSTYELPPRSNKVVDTKTVVYVSNNIVDKSSVRDFAVLCGLNEHELSKYITDSCDQRKELCREALRHLQQTKKKEGGKLRVSELKDILVFIKHGRLADDVLNGRIDNSLNEEEVQRNKLLSDAFLIVRGLCALRWSDLARANGLTPNEIDILRKNDADDLGAQCLQSLENWKRKVPRDECTVEKLIEHLRTARLGEAADEVSSLLSSSPTTFSADPSQSNDAYEASPVTDTATSLRTTESAPPPRTETAPSRGTAETTI